ncbi:MAG: hypothetical protein IJR85_06455 [Synergistaceae bacterium]|nr:hypothetical protein [Synergistaceae bacterium]
MPDDSLMFDVRAIAEATAKRDEPPPPPPEPPKNTQPEFLALKSTFTPSRGDMGGGFCVIFEGKTGKTVFQAFWLAKPYSTGTLIESTQNWRKFVQSLPQMGPLDKNWGGKLQEQLKDILRIEEKKKLYENYTRPKLRQIESMMRRSFEGITQCVFSATTDAEPVSRNELERAKIIKPLPPSPAELARIQKEQEEREKAQEEERAREEAKKDAAFDGTIIMCAAMVDPVRGKASSEISPGDIIGVSIEGEGTSALVKKFMEENNIEPMFPVVEIKETAGKKFIYVKISDEIRGAIAITKDIKIKIKEDRPPDQPDQHSISFLGDVFFFGLLGVALIALLFVIRYFFF